MKNREYIVSTIPLFISISDNHSCGENELSYLCHTLKYTRAVAKDTLFDYSKVPYNFGLCVATNCPHGDTCLRRIAYNHTPANVTFPPTLNLKTIEAMAGKCKYYRSNEPVRYGKGFVRTTEALTVRMAGKFRYTLIGRWGMRKYYQKRKGETLLSLAEQEEVVALAKQLGVRLEEYFDAYVEEYDWG